MLFGETIANPTDFMILVLLTGCLPFFVTMVTSYCKIICVCSLVRNALGVQQVPPGMVLSGLAMILTVFIMAPVGAQTFKEFEKLPPRNGDYGMNYIIENGPKVLSPLKEFLKSNSDQRISKAFVSGAKRIWPADFKDAIDEDSLVFVVPTFVISELTKAFQIGFLLYLPFVAIDLIISNILLAMGMMMVSPMSISLPFKLMLFVSLDGWLKLSQGLMYSYGM